MEFLTVGIIILLAVISPGPDFFIVVKNALTYSQSAGVYSALGIASATSIHVTYCLFGLVFLITESEWGLHIVKWLGAGYLIYLGCQSLLSRRVKAIDTPMDEKIETVSPTTAFLQGFWTNLLNPKAILFFLALFTIVIEPTTPLWKQSIFGLQTVLLGGVWFSFLAWAIGHRLVRKRLQRIQYYITKLMGIFLLYFGIHLIYMQL